MSVLAHCCWQTTNRPVSADLRIGLEELLGRSLPKNDLLLIFFTFRYFGSAEGSKFVEMASVDNVKRTWVNYGQKRDWTNPIQGQVMSLKYT